MKDTPIPNGPLEDVTHSEESMNESRSSSSPHPVATLDVHCHMEKLERSNITGVNYKLMWSQTLWKTTWYLLDVLSINLPVLLLRV